MKFFICILALFALSMSNTQANIVPLALNPILYSAAFGSSPVVVSALAQSPVHLYNAPLIGLTPQASYVAKTPSSEHIASLPGHFISSSSINLEQAPGINTDENKKTVKDSSSSLVAPSVATLIPGSVLPITYSSFIVPQPAPIVLPTQATYVAKNLGVEHIAPLPGHSISATSLNLEPAPGSQ